MSHSDCDTLSVLIAGYGDLGQRIGRLLTGQGRHVVGLRRHVETVPAGVELMAVDLAAGVPDLPAFTQVVFCAAPDGGDPAAYHAVYETAWGNLLTALAAMSEPPQRVLLVTSTRGYAQNDGGWVDEDSPVGARDPQTASLLAAEAMLRRSGLPGLVLRLAGLYGSGEGPLLRSLREGRASRAAGPARWSNRIHRDDAARAVAHLLGLADPAPLYLGVDSEPTDHGRLLCELAEWLRLPAPPMVELPPPAVNRRCRNERLLASGFRFLYPGFREGYRALLAASGGRS